MSPSDIRHISNRAALNRPHLMNTQFSIVIPTLNAADTLPATLDSLLSGLSAGVVRDLVISDGGSSDHTKKLADDVGATLVEGAIGRGSQLHRGAEAAKAEWLLFLHADTVLPADWVGAVCVHTSKTPEAAAAFRLSFQEDGVFPRVTSGWANLRSKLFGLPYGDQGLLISKSLYKQVGGYPDQPLMEDVAIARALKGRLVLLPSYVTTGADRYIESGWLNRGARNLWTLARYLLGADPQKLALAYHKR